MSGARLKGCPSEVIRLRMDVPVSNARDLRAAKRLAKRYPLRKRDRHKRRPDVLALYERELNRRQRERDAGFDIVRRGFFTLRRPKVETK